MTDNAFDIATDLQPIRVEQARVIKAKAKASALIVEISVITYSLLIAASVSVITGLVWFGAANFMVLVTLIYAKFQAPNGITDENYKAYLFGHTIICALTGLVWGGFAIYIFDLNDPFAFIVAITLPSILTVGGMLPSSAYRPGYIALAIFALLPLGLFLMLTLPGIHRIYGIGILIFFGLGMLASAQAELNTRDGIIARRVHSFSEDLYKKNLEIERANDEKSRFLAATSHDFSQPLHAQGYYIDALKTQLDTPEQAELLEKIRGAWQAQKDLLEGLAEVTRLDSGAIKPTFETFDLQTLTNQVVSDLTPAAVSRQVTIINHVPSSKALSDSQLLGRIIRNILHNAIKFTDMGGKVELSATHDEDANILSISDEGFGISAEDQDHIFDAYYQSDRNSERSGKGLGLSIVKRLCDLLNIEIEVKSEEGIGTEFLLRIPISSEALTANEQYHEKDFSFSDSPLVVLVDDNDDIRESMLVELTRWGLMVIATKSGEDAISLLSDTAETPIALIVDKRLSQGENGIETISALREELNEDIAAILMTGDVTGFEDISEDDDIEVLLKPVFPSDLKQRIRKLRAT